jgi:DNA-binding beta-propeller fold protein YncE
MINVPYSFTKYVCRIIESSLLRSVIGGPAGFLRITLCDGAQIQASPIMQFSNGGTFAPMGPVGSPVGSLNDNLGLWGDPVNGHLIAASSSGLVDITPSTGAVRVINSSLFPDGVTVSPDGTKIFAALNGNVVEVDMTSGAILATFNGQGRGPDGTGVLIGGQFNGDIVVNNNDGTVGLIDPTVVNPTETIIANMGTRGDFVSADTSNGTLFLSQLQAVDRLGCGPGCSISVSPGVPEPSTWVMMLLGFAGLGFAFRQSRRKVAFANLQDNAGSPSQWRTLSTR